LLHTWIKKVETAKIVISFKSMSVLFKGEQQAFKTKYNIVHAQFVLYMY